MPTNPINILKALRDLKLTLKAFRAQLKDLRALPQYADPDTAAVTDPPITTARQVLATQIDAVTAAMQAIAPTNAEKVAYATALMTAASADE